MATRPLDGATYLMGPSEFADSAVIVARRNFLTRALLAESSAELDSVMFAPDAVISDPLVRMFAHGSPGGSDMPTLAALERQILKLIEAEREGLKTAHLSAARRPSIVCSSDNALWAPIQSRWADENPGQPTTLSVLDDAAVGALRLGISTLAGRVPELMAGLLPHVNAIAVFDSPRNVGSCTAFSLPGVIMINKSLLTDTLRLADLLFHESVHCKFYDIMGSTRLLGGSADEQFVCPPWHAEANDERASKWVISRAMGALHVYAHYSALDARTDLGSQEWRGSASERASILAALLSGTEVDLTVNGRRFVEWNRRFLADADSDTDVMAPAYGPVSGDVSPAVLATSEADIAVCLKDPNVRLYSLQSLDYYLVASTEIPSIQRIDVNTWRILRRLVFDAQRSNSRTVPVPVRFVRALSGLAHLGLVELEDFHGERPRRRG